MTDTPRTWTSFSHWLLTAQAENGQPQVALLRTEAGWLIPFDQQDRFVWMPEVAGFIPRVIDQLNQQVVVLYSSAFDVNDDSREVHGVYVLEPLREVIALPPDMQWIDCEQVEALQFANPKHRDLIKSAVAELFDGNVPVLRRDWAQRGWFDEATNWIRVQLHRKQYQILGPISQVRTWGISAVLKVLTDRGDVYFKAHAHLPLFVSEPAIVHQLSSIILEHLPTSIAADEQKQWLLTADLGSSIRKTATVEQCEQVITDFGRIQIEMIPHADSLLASGWLDRRPSRLDEMIDKLFADPTVKLQLGESLFETLIGHANTFKSICAEIQTYNIPATLLHGDLHLGNIAMPADKPIYFDWTDACISHPFFDLVTMFDEITSITKSESVNANLLDSYLCLWDQYESLERAREVWRLAAPLGSLHQMVSYQTIVNNVDAISQRELSEGLRQWATRAIEYIQGKRLI
jgi:hypothetical protein